MKNRQSHSSLGQCPSLCPESPLERLLANRASPPDFFQFPRWLRQQPPGKQPPGKRRSRWICCLIQNKRIKHIFVVIFRMFQQENLKFFKTTILNYFKFKIRLISKLVNFFTFSILPFCFTIILGKCFESSHFVAFCCFLSLSKLEFGANAWWRSFKTRKNYSGGMNYATPILSPFTKTGFEKRHFG